MLRYLHLFCRSNRKNISAERESVRGELKHETGVVIDQCVALRRNRCLRGGVGLTAGGIEAERLCLE